MKDYLIHISLVTLFAVIVKWAVSLHPYSGAGKPPMFGDYEAQRHWMEITYNLPVKDWYVDTSDNNLTYWGLDYPPLTAYHSWLCGAIAHRMNSSWVELHKSRGHESYEHKLFMRYSVLVADVLVFFPAVFVYFMSCSVVPDRSSQIASALIMLLYPGLILIDYGHFQYNCVSLGLTIWGIMGLCRGHDVLGSIAFVLALNYKQMELYHAFPFFCLLFGRCLGRYSERGVFASISKLFFLSLTVLSTFLVCWFPFLNSWQLVLQVLSRIFPFSRGLFEDKVANVWCSLSVLIKFKQILSISTLIRMCFSTTVLLLIPSSLDLIIRPSVTKFKYSLVNSSLIFFLFSFHVHEKSILLAALPVCLLLPDHPLICVWFLFISTFSMLPLIVKDEIFVAYLATMVLFYFLTDIMTNSGLLHVTKSETGFGLFSNRFLSILFATSVFGMAVLTVLLLLVQPPKRFPDLFTVAVSTYSCLHFVYFLLHFHWLQFSVLSSVQKSPSQRTLDTKTAKLKSS